MLVLIIMLLLSRSSMLRAVAPRVRPAAVRAFCAASKNASAEEEAAATKEQHEASDEDEEFAVRERVLAAALLEVPKHGWSTAALSAGAVACGLSSAAHGGRFQ